MPKVTQRTLDTVTAEANIIAAPLGLETERTEFVREAGIWYLRVIIRHAQGEPVSLTDCESVHRPLSKRLDELDPIPGTYYLEVTSPGSTGGSEPSTDPSANSPIGGETE